MLLPEWVWPVAIMGAIGGFIDFLLGKAGRAKLVTALEDWWVRFDDVSKINFGRKEAEFAISVLDNWFGEFFSVRRFVVCVGIMLGWWTWGASGFWGIPFESGVVQYGIYLALTITCSYFGLSLSISFSRRIAVLTAALMTENAFFNLLLFLGLLLLTYVSMAFWLPMTRTISSTLLFWVRVRSEPGYTFSAYYSMMLDFVAQFFFDMHWNVLKAMREILAPPPQSELVRVSIYEFPRYQYIPG